MQVLTAECRRILRAGRDHDDPNERRRPRRSSSTSRKGELVEIVGRWLRGTTPDDVPILIATQAHRTLFAAAAAVEGVDGSSHGRVVWLDAVATLQQLMVASAIDQAAFDAVIGGVVRDAARSGRSVRVYGEMVALLSDAGNVLGAIELEELWNDRARKIPFRASLLLP